MFKTMLGIGMAMLLAACAGTTANGPTAEIPAGWEVGEPSAWRATDPAETEVRKAQTPAYATTTTTAAAPSK